MPLARAVHRTPAHRACVPAAPPRVPACGRCGPGFPLTFHEYVPAVYAVDGSGLRPPSASYSCARCGTKDSHQVPAGWAPPEWQWYS
jgi:hypothetical protein